MKRYIITFSDNVQSEKQIFDLFNSVGINVSRIVTAQGSKPEKKLANQEIVFLKNLGIAIALLSHDERSNLLALKEVQSVEDDIEVKAHNLSTDIHPRVLHPGHTAIWNMNLIRAQWVWQAGQFGTGIKVAILDTGIAAHPNLRTYGGASFVATEPNFRDGNGHGTHCAGVVAGKGRNDVFGVAPGAELYAVKVLDRNGSGSSADVISGMDWCISAGINVISMSLGSESPPRTSYARAIKRCQEKNIVSVCSAGNGFGGQFPWVGSPANSYVAGDQLASPIAVAAVDSLKTVANFSSRGTNSNEWNPVTACAPGVSVLSTHLNAGYRTMSGTSMACPHISGLAALLLATHRGASTQIIKALITLNTEELGTQPAPNDAYGHGLIDCAAAVGIGTTRDIEQVNA